MTTEVATIDYRGTAIHVQGEFVAVRQMADAMGLDWSAQRRLILNNPWSEGCTVVSTTQLPGDTQAREHFFLHRRRVPMWVANISTGHIQDGAVKATVIRWQNEIADVLADYYEGKPKVSRAPRRKRIAGPGTLFPDELEFLRQSGARRVKLPSGFEIEFATEGTEYALSLVKSAVETRVIAHDQFVIKALEETRENVRLSSAWSRHEVPAAPMPFSTSGRGDDFVDPDPKDKGYTCQ